MDLIHVKFKNTETSRILCENVRTQQNVKLFKQFKG